MANEIITEKHGQALAIIFNRPDHGNAFTHTMATQLFQALKLITTDHGIRAVLLCGQGGNFMDGLDLDSLYTGSFDVALTTANQLMHPYHSAIREINAMDKPVIAAVEGSVRGPGLSLMLACDMVIAASNTVFNCDFTSYGMSPDGGAAYNLARKVGAGRATELLMLSENFNAEDAERFGLINRIVAEDKLQDEAMAWLDRLANGPTKAYGGVKRTVTKAFEQDHPASLALEHTYWGASSRTFDFRDAIKAHLAKRDVKFTGA